MQNVNDPTIMSDDILRWSKIALIALLAFTTLLSGFSYFKFFEKSFGFEIAFAMALLLACIIEFGKNWGFLRVLRIPFFHGWGHIWSTVANTILWGGLLALAAVTFSASVYNSTKGAHQLSILLGHEKNATSFVPNTSDIDAQISATEKRIADNRATRWKGTTTVDAQRAIKTETRTLETLQKQRETRIQQQRADYDRETGIKDSQNQFSAKSLMAVGGWVELLQIILMFVRVSAERSLDKTASDRRNEQTHYSVGNGQPRTNGHPQQPIHNTVQRYYFNRPSPTGNVESSLDRQPLFPDNKNTVPQSPHTVPQQNAPNGASYADSVIEVCRQAIQRDIGNFENRQAKNATVARRIHDALDTCYTALKQRDFAPSYQIGLRLYNYLQETVWPRLNVIGQPYENQTFFTERLYHAFTPKKEAV